MQCRTIHYWLHRLTSTLPIVMLKAVLANFIQNFALDNVIYCFVTLLLAASFWHTVVSTDRKQHEPQNLVGTGANGDKLGPCSEWKLVSLATWLPLKSVKYKLNASSLPNVKCCKGKDVLNQWPALCVLVNLSCMSPITFAFQMSVKHEILPWGLGNV